MSAMKEVYERLIVSMWCNGYKPREIAWELGWRTKCVKRVIKQAKAGAR